MAPNFSIEGALRSHPSRGQRAFKATVEDEVGNQIFRFPPKELACTLSPKIPKSGTKTSGEPFHIKDYDCEVDSGRFTRALNDVVNGRLEPFSPIRRSGKAPHSEAEFVPWCSDTTHLLPAGREGDRYMSLTSERILFRSLGVRGRMTQVFLLRLPTSAPPTDPRPSVKGLPEPDLEFTYPFRGSRRLVEQNRTSLSLVQGAAIMGGSGFRDPFPAKAVTSVKHTSEKVTFLSKVPEQTHGELVDDSGTRLKCYKPRNIVRAEDYPILSETTNIVVLKTSWPGIDRQHNGTEMYQGCNGRFGVMPHVSSYEVTGQYGEVISNILFFPEKDKIGDYHWVVSPRMPPTELDIRTYDYSILSLNGRPLIHAENPFELSRAWACFLIGWLSMYLSGHLHRDPSLGNVLLAPVEETKPFEIPEKFLTHVSSLKDEKAAEEIKELCGKVEKLVGELDLPIESHAVIGDGDLAVPWETYWTDDRRAFKSGTPEFMSRALIAAEEEDKYLHSPVDDLESFFWVAVWSVFFNQKGGQSWEAEKGVRQALLNNEKDAAMDKFWLLTTRKNRNNATKCFQDVIEGWWEIVGEQNKLWRQAVTRDPRKDAKAQYYLPHSHRFALRGVMNVLQLLQAHWYGGISWKSWTGP